MKINRAKNCDESKLLVARGIKELRSMTHCEGDYRLETRTHSAAQYYRWGVAVQDPTPV